MIISGMSGNELYCLSRKGYGPGEIVVGNSVFSMGVAGWLGSVGRTMAGGEIPQITQLISEGRHAAIERMEAEARKHGASGVTSVVSEVKTLAGFTEFLSQGTGVHDKQGRGGPFFSTSASGIDMYCHLDAGYRPIKFAMGNVAYALGLARGLSGSLRTLARGEVREYSQMYNEIRHLALRRLCEEAARVGANAVVDLSLKMLPHASGALELLITGTASRNEALAAGPAGEARITSSELTGVELWNMARLGYAPVSLVMATSVYSLGLTGNLGAMFQGMSRGELPEVTSLIYHARENCLELLRKEAMTLGAEGVVGNKLMIVEMAPGIIEIFAIGTAIRPLSSAAPETPELIPQALIVDEASEGKSSLTGVPTGFAQVQPFQRGGRGQAPTAAGCLVGAVVLFFSVIVPIIVGIVTALSKSGHR